MFKKLLLTISILSLNFQTMAQDMCQMPEQITKMTCMALRIDQNSTKNRVDELMALERTQNQLLAASELQERLKSNDDTFQMFTLEEELTNSLATLFEEKSSARNRAIGSVGALMLFSGVVYHMNKTTRGQSLKRRLIAQIIPKNGKLLRTSINFAFVISLASAAYSTMQIKEIADQTNNLQDMISVLNQLKDQADSILRMREEIEEKQACFWFKAEQMVQMGIATFEGEQFMCLD